MPIKNNFNELLIEVCWRKNQQLFIFTVQHIPLYEEQCSMRVFIGHLRAGTLFKLLTPIRNNKTNTHKRKTTSEKKSITIKIAALALGVIFSSAATAQFTAVTSGDWTNSATWGGNGYNNGYA